MKTIILRVSIIDDYGDTDCWREIEVAAASTLSKLAEGIVEAFGFDFDHAFGFYGELGRRYMKSAEKYELFVDMGEGDGRAKGVRRTKVGGVFREVGIRMQFVFDYGDEWRFLVEVTGTGDRVKGRRYPRLVDAHGKAPEQYPDWDEE